MPASASAGQGVREQSRALLPDEAGYVERNGVCIGYEVYGGGEPTVLLMPTWSIVHSRVWKMQIPYLARHCRVVVFDGRGNGRSDRPDQPADYDESEYADDAVAVLDATNTARAVVVSFSLGAQAGEARIRDVVTSAGFTRFRRVAETPFNIVFEARP